MKKGLLKKILISVSVSLVSVFIILVVLISCLWGNEIASVMSIKLLAEENKEIEAAPVYLMDVKGDYYLDDFVEQGGVSNDNELIDFIVGNIAKGIIPIKLEAPTLGCAGFTCEDENGTRYFGRNYDLEPTTTMIVRTNPKGDNRYASISSCDLKFLGITEGKHLDSLLQKVITLAAPYIPLDGINEMGLSCGVLMTYQGNKEAKLTVATDQQTDKPDFTTTTMLRMILDYCANIDEAIELINKYDLHDSANTSFHYMIADASGRSAILEWVSGDEFTDTDGTKRQLNVIYNDQDSNIGTMEGNDNFQYVTNFIVSEGYHSSDTYKAGLDRYLKVQSMINPDGSNTKGLIQDKNVALNVLKTVARRTWNKTNNLDSNIVTPFSALYDLTNKKVTWVNNEQFDNPKEVYEFDFSYLK